MCYRYLVAATIIKIAPEAFTTGAANSITAINPVALVTLSPSCARAVCPLQFCVSHIVNTVGLFLHILFSQTGDNCFGGGILRIYVSCEIKRPAFASSYYMPRMYKNIVLSC